MALRLFPERRQYFQGELVLYRGDRWQVDFVVEDRVVGAKLSVDLAGCAVSAFFPANCPATYIAASGEITDAPNGRFRAVVPPEYSATAGLSDGAALFAIVSGPASSFPGPITVSMTDENVAIRDRGFDL